MSRSPQPLDLDGDEDDSLFGSPPPSPGRSPSPGLALPGSSSNASGNIVSTLTKNVGTIALPGSQSNSEYLNPLASSLSLPTASTRHPLPSSGSSDGTISVPPTPQASTSALPQKAPTKAPKARKRKQRPTDGDTPRPEIEIPSLDPSAPLPSNFLRNQSALLGHAGLVAGVKPANLVHRARGTSSSNPIVIEEEFRERKQAPASAPRSRPRPTPHPRHQAPPTIQPIQDCLDKPGLVMPSKQEIMACLVKEKDIFPIIQSLIKLTAPGAKQTPPNPAPSTRSSEEPSKDAPRTKIVGTHATGYPMKKRKLNRVPAGAADWDIPYPFDQGEGPTEYQETWQGERGKELIEQLINLIKNATKKAAMQNYLKGKFPGKTKKSKAKDDNKRFDDEPRVNKYYKAITATYGLPPSKSTASSRQSTPAKDYSSSRSVTPSTAPAPSTSSGATTPAPEQAQGSDSLDLLLSSLFAMTQPVRHQTKEASTSSVNKPEDSLAGLGVDQSWLDDWMKSLEPSGRMNSDGSFSQSFGSGAPPVDLDFSMLDFSDLGMPSGSAGATGLQSSTDPLCDAANSVFPIDPVLIALSAPSVDGTAQPTAVTSPTETNPITPLSADWDMTMLDIFSPSYPSGGGESLNTHGLGLSSSDAAHGNGGDLLWDAFMSKDMGIDSLPEASGERDGSTVTAGTISDVAQGHAVHPSSCNKNEGSSENAPVASTPLSIPQTEREEISMSAASPHSQVPALGGPLDSHGENSARPQEAAAVPPFNTITVTSSTSSKPTLLTEKEELVKRARERKALLEVELNKVKLQLWEATIEQGGLNHILGHYQEQEKGAKHTPTELESVKEGTPLVSVDGNRLS